MPKAMDVTPSMAKSAAKRAYETGPTGGEGGDGGGRGGLGGEGGGGGRGVTVWLWAGFPNNIAPPPC